MKINLRQEIAMWVLGLFWTWLGFMSLIDPKDQPFGLRILPMVIVLVPIFLVIFTLRDRHKS
jgi:hypothetical protein